MTKYAQAIKAELAMELAKVGSSLEEFEQHLQGLNTGEGVLKAAEIGSDVLASNFVRPGLEIAGSIPEMALKSSLAGGAISGLTLDEMDSSVDSLNKSLDREREKIKLVRRITENLRREHGL